MSRRRVVSLQRFEHLDNISIFDETIHHGNCFRFVFTITLTVFDVHFRWSFLGNRAHKKGKNILRHYHVISLVPSTIALDQWAPLKLLSHCKISFLLPYRISTYSAIHPSLTFFLKKKQQFKVFFSKIKTKYISQLNIIYKRLYSNES